MKCVKNTYSVNAPRPGAFQLSRGCPMPTFPKPKPPLTEQIRFALVQLRAARYDGSAVAIYVAQQRFDRLLDGGRFVHGASPASAA